MPQSTGVSTGRPLLAATSNCKGPSTSQALRKGGSLSRQPWRSTRLEKSRSRGFQSWVCAPSAVASQAGTPLRPQAQYCGQGSIQRTRAKASANRRLCQNSWRPSVCPAGRIGQQHSSNQGATSA